MDGISVITIETFKNKRKSKYSSFVTIFYKIEHIINAFDFGFFDHVHESNTKRVFWKCVTAVYGFFMAFFYLKLMNSDSVFRFMWGIFHVVHYVANVLILVTIRPEKSFCQMQHDFLTIDENLGVRNTTPITHRKLVFALLLNIVYNIINKLFFCLGGNPCVGREIKSFLLAILKMFLEVVPITSAYFFYSVYCRLVKLTKIIENENRETVSMHRLYQSIAKLTELYKSMLDPLIFGEIIFSTGELMSSLLYMIKKKREIQLGTHEVTAVFGIVYIMAPAVFAEKVARQVTEIGIALQQKLMQERDPGRQREVERFIQYVEARPLRFRVYRVIPLDASLFGMVLHFFVTYLIVIIQFIFM